MGLCPGKHNGGSGAFLLHRENEPWTAGRSLLHFLRLAQAHVVVVIAVVVVVFVVVVVVVAAVAVTKVMLHSAGLNTLEFSTN